ncbi:MFS transporter [Aliiglaciecola lipolytica]|uniref:MFS transporter, OHS family, lactose permease n=1 Tax=Aliiglaciecola lipolytica E3 TaxID=1127673 RepID=K6Y668_9ALTE|nr:MFS transporter [Aliiglaciecola lipolytica]GAC13722.1 MFS transporter, OHS family, lactose permease [Aliiglaciecola lipolytica E3]
MSKSIKNYWLLSGAFFTFFLCWSFSFSLFPIWLNQYIGLSGELTGTIFSCNAIAGLFVMPCYGYLQDKLGLRKHLLLFIGVMLIAVGPFFIFVYSPLLLSHFYLGALLGGVFFAVVFGAGIGALESYVEKVARSQYFEFGRARMWGSLGWASATFFAGYLFNKGPDINFWLASLSACVFMLLIFLLEPLNEENSISTVPCSSQRKLDLKLVSGLLLMRKFWAFVIFVMGVTCIYSVYDQQFAVYYSSMFSDQQKGNAMYGYLNSMQVFLEAGCMFFAPFLVNKIGAKNGLILSGFIMALRIIGSGLADDIVMLSIMKLLHAVELPIMLVAVFKYITNTFDTRLSATLYIVGFQFSSQITASGLSIYAGIMYDKLGFSTSYLILGGIVFIFTLISFILLSSDKPSI